MADFTALRLQRIAASAYDLVANAFLGEPSALGLQGAKQEPVCTEPFCGGLYWKEGAGWHPEEAPPLPAVEKPEEHGPTGDPSAHAPKPKSPGQAVSDKFAATPLDKLDLTGAKVYLPLDKPIAKRVRMLPANRDEWQWWMAENSKKILLGVEKDGVTPNLVKGDQDRENLMDHLTPWLRLDEDVTIAGQTIPKGSQLMTVKPRGSAPLRVTPWIGSREQLRHDDFPLTLTFGKPRKPDLNYDQPKGGKARPVGGPPDERREQEPVTLPVKRLDVVLKKPREGLSDFLPPLLTGKEPHLEEMDEEEM